MSASLRTGALIVSRLRTRGAAKNLALWLRLFRYPEASNIWNQYFLPEEYLEMYPDIKASGVSPAVHFILCGAAERRNPSKQFDTRYYLGRYPEVAASGLNPLLHYALFGKEEGRTLTREVKEVDGAHEPGGSAIQYVNNEWPGGQPLLSVVIPCFNYGRFIEEAIRSVLGQTFQDFEIIVVEGGSTDESTVQKVRQLESLGLPKTRFYYREGRHLVGDNRNFGISLAHGRYVCCLDADDVLQPVYLEVAVFLAEVYGHDIVYPSVQCFGESDACWLIYDAGFPQILDENQISTVALFRRSAWAHVGGYRDWGLGQQHVVEDWDLWIRFLAHGFVAKSIREPLLKYRVHSASLTRTSMPEMNVQRQRLRAANLTLIESASCSEPLRRSVINPYANLGSLEDSRPGFLLALPFITIGGAEKLFRNISQSIVDSGYRLIVITSLTLSDAVPEDASSFGAITPHCYHLSQLFQTDPERFAFLRYVLRRYRVTTLMLAGCEFVYHLLPELKREFPSLGVVDQIFNDTVHVYNNRYYEKHIDATIVPSDPLFRAIIERHCANPSSVHIIPHGIQIAKTIPASQAGALPAASHEKIIVAYFGRLSYEKGPDRFVEIVRRLSRDSSLYFVMTGEGPEREKVFNLIRDYGLTDRIYTPGFVDDIQALMNAVDIVVLPSRIDGMPLAVLEAQALGKSVVASRIGSLPEMISEAQTGFLCEPDDVNLFCERISSLAHDPGMRARIGAAARVSVTEKYSSGRMIEQYHRVFHQIGKSRLVAALGVSDDAF
jgi:glycosyltransferase involved in cell wall biosynthesis